MTRTLIALPDEMMSALNHLAKAQHVSRAALIRMAVKQFLQNKTTKPSTTAFGILSESRLEDSVKLQRKIRDEWNESGF